MAYRMGPYTTKAEAISMVRWQSKGGFASRIVGRRGAYYVEPMGYNAKGQADHDMLRGTRSD